MTGSSKHSAVSVERKIEIFSCSNQTVKIFPLSSRLLPGHVSLQLGQGGEPLVSPDSPLPELLQGNGPSHGGLQGGHLSLVRLQLLPGGK